MNLKENRLVAWIVLAAVALGTVFIGGGGALKGKQQAVMDLFNANSGSISADLKDAADAAVVMNSIAANAQGVNQTYVTAVTDGVDALRAAESVSDKSAATQALTTAVENLYSNASGLSLSDKDASDLKYYHTEYTSAMARISHSGYNDAAAEYSKLSGDPLARLISAVRGIANTDQFE